jgi:hypothetical protein
MPNTTSASLKLTVQATGENSGTWGQITNTNLLILEQAIGGYAGVALNATTGATLTFSNGALSDGKNQVLKLTGTITTNVDVIVPDSVEKTYVVENATSGAFTVTVKTTSGSGVTWGTTDKGKKLIYSDGTDILEGISSIDTLKVSTFTSTGIDDNATSTAITINSSEQVEFTAGTALLPAITTTGDTNTGMWFPAADTIAFSEGGVEAMRITSAGRLGIGTSSPDAPLEVNSGNSDTNSIFKSTDNNCIIIISDDDSSSTIGVDNDGSGGALKFNTGGDGSYSGNSEAMRIDSTGNVGIGTSSPDRELTVGGVDNARIGILSTSTSVGASQLQFGDPDNSQVGRIYYEHSDNSMRLHTNNTEQMRITSTGNVGIGTTSPGTDFGKVLHISGASAATATTGGSRLFYTGTNGSGNWSVYDGTAAAYRAIIDSSGRVMIGTTTEGQETADNLTIADTGHCGITLRSGASSVGSIFFSDATSGADEYVGYVQYNHTDNYMKWQTNGAERMRIDSSGNVGIGTTSPNAFAKLHIVDGAGTLPAMAAGDVLTIQNNNDISDNAGLTAISGTSGISYVQFGDSADKNPGAVYYYNSDNSMRFLANASERMRIDSSGTLFIGKTTTAVATAGLELYADGFCQQTRSAATVQLFNRTTSDGIIIDFRQAGTSEGNISVSGSTVSYNGFTGTHWSRFTDNSKPNILRGTVLETLDEMCDWYNLEFDVTTQDDEGNDVTTTEKVPHVLLDSQSNGDVITYNHEGTDYQATIVKENDVKHMMSKVSDTTDAKNVYGVFVAYDEDGEGYNDFYVASVGSFVVRIKANETIAKGDLLQSNGDGTAKVQTDDAVRSSSFAKVLSTTIIETYDDGSYLVPCSLMC